MAWTIILAVLGAISQAVTMWLGFHITASPEIVLNKPKVFWYRFTFGAMLLLSLVVTAITAYRGTRVEHVQVERVHISFIQTEFLSKPWPLVGEKLGVNIHYKNISNGMAHDVLFYGYSFLKPDYSPYSEKEAIEEFEKWVRVFPEAKESSLAKDTYRWATAEGAILTPEDLNNLSTGRKVMYVVSVVQFRDDVGKRTLRICRFLQPPEPTRSGASIRFGDMASCSRYNDEVEGWLTDPTS
jgi:hypothetical protein